MKGSVDRIEEGIAVIIWDDGTASDMLQPGLKEGDRVEGDMCHAYKIDDGAKERIKRLQEAVLGKKK